MGKLMEKFDKLSDDEKTNISILIHGIDNIIELDDKLIFDTKNFFQILILSFSFFFKILT